MVESLSYGSRLLIVDTCRTKKDPFAAVFEGEVVPLTLTSTLTSTSTIDNCGRRHCPGVSDSNYVTVDADLTAQELF